MWPASSTPFPRRSRPELLLDPTARGDGLVPLWARWIQESSSATPPERLLFQTEKGTTIRGRVLDQDGQPLAGAMVVVIVKKAYPRSEQRVDMAYESTKPRRTRRAPGLSLRRAGTAG